jgi:hypothetical protein
LADRHPDLFEQFGLLEFWVLKDANSASTAMKGRLYTLWSRETFPEFIAPGEETLARHADAVARAQRNRTSVPLAEALTKAPHEEDDTMPCQVCAL